jgi:hypothetical protein
LKVKDSVVNAADWSLEAASNMASSVPVRGAGRVAGALQNVRANDAVPVVVVVAAAAFAATVAALGFAGAWAFYCARQGMYPALDQPPISGGGTWKLYCAK